MNSFFRRTPKNYDGTALTTHSIGEVLSTVMSRIGGAYKDCPELVLAAWPDILGAKLAPMTQPMSFVDGILTVKVKNSTLYSLLSQHEKPRLLAALRQKFPKLQIRNIVLRVG